MLTSSQKTFNDLKDFLATQLPAAIVPWAAAVVWLETRGMASTISRKNNNWSNIKYVKQFGAKQGSSAASDGGGYFAKYDTRYAWLADFKRILSFNRGAGRPVDATNVMDFVARMKRNGYFASSEASYLAGIKSILKQMGSDQTAVAIQANNNVKAGAEKVTKQWKAADVLPRSLPSLPEINTDYKTWGTMTWVAVALGAIILLDRR